MSVPSVSSVRVCMSMRGPVPMVTWIVPVSGAGVGSVDWLQAVAARSMPISELRSMRMAEIFLFMNVAKIGSQAVKKK